MLSWHALAAPLCRCFLHRYELSQGLCVLWLGLEGVKLSEHCGGKAGVRQVLWHRESWDQWCNLWHLGFSWIWGTHRLLWNKILSIKLSFTGARADISLQEMIYSHFSGWMCVLISNTEIKSKKCCWFYGLCQYWEWIFNYYLNYSSS